MSELTAIAERYGLDLWLVLAILAAGEIVFCGSLAMLLKEAGSRVTWRAMRQVRLRQLHLGSTRMLAWLWVNRLSAVIPWTVIILMSLGKVPRWATWAACVEVLVTIGIGVVASLGLKLPWWNGEERS